MGMLFFEARISVLTNTIKMRPIVLLAILGVAVGGLCTGTYAGLGCGSCVGCSGACQSDGSCGISATDSCDPGYTKVANGGATTVTQGVVYNNCAGYFVRGGGQWVNDDMSDTTHSLSHNFFAAMRREFIPKCRKPDCL